MPFPFDGVFGSDFFTLAVLGMGKVGSKVHAGRHSLRTRKSDCTTRRHPWIVAVHEIVRERLVIVVRFGFPASNPDGMEEMTAQEQQRDDQLNAIGRELFDCSQA
jgi:hypothetical protein